MVILSHTLPRSGTDFNVTQAFQRDQRINANRLDQKKNLEKFVFAILHRFEQSDRGATLLPCAILVRL